MINITLHDVSKETHVPQYFPTIDMRSRFDPFCLQDGRLLKRGYTDDVRILNGISGSFVSYTAMFGGKSFCTGVCTTPYTHLKGR